MSAKTLIELRNVKKFYGVGEGNVVKALKSVSLKIKEGEFVTIFGPSGCGKSTLMHLMGLLDKPTDGKVLISGVDNRTLSRKQVTRLRSQLIGFVFQSFFLTPNLTAFENVEFPMVLINKGVRERRLRARELLEKMDLLNRMNHLPYQLSGGQKQRVAIARALANKPKIILADEPTGNLDSKTGSEVIKLFKDLWKQGATLVVITHDQALASQAPRIIYMKDGEITKDQINTHPKIMDVKKMGGELKR